MYSKQTAKLLARIAEAMPPMHSDQMQQWIEKPLALQRVLKRVFNPARIIRPPRFLPVWKKTPADGDWVAVTPADLGFANGNVTAGEMCDRAIEVGLELCPHDVAYTPLKEEIGNGLIIVFGPVDANASHADYHEYHKFICEDMASWTSAYLNLNEKRNAKVRWIFKCK